MMKLILKYFILYRKLKVSYVSFCISYFFEYHEVDMVTMCLKFEDKPQQECATSCYFFILARRVKRYTDTITD